MVNYILKITPVLSGGQVSSYKWVVMYESESMVPQVVRFRTYGTGSSKYGCPYQGEERVRHKEQPLDTLNRVVMKGQTWFNALEVLDKEKIIKLGTVEDKVVERDEKLKTYAY